MWDYNICSDLPGAPNIIRTTYVLGRPYTAEVQLSDVGSPPILEVVLVVKISNAQLFFPMSGSYMPGDYILFNLSGLPDDSSYTFSAYAVNYAGKGPYSTEATKVCKGCKLLHIPFSTLFI